MRSFFVVAFAILAVLFTWIAMITGMALAWLMAVAAAVMTILSGALYIHDALRDEPPTPM